MTVTGPYGEHRDRERERERERFFSEKEETPRDSVVGGLKIRESFFGILL